MTPAQRKRTDVAMLDSLAATFDMWAGGGQFLLSFNPRDVADLMRRCAQEMEPGPKLVSTDPEA